jgi:putative addiction module CopG family antidote
MSMTTIPVKLPKALKEHIEQRVAAGEFASPADYIRSLIRADRSHAERREALLRDLDLGLEDVEAGRVYDGEQVFSELLACAREGTS